VSDKKTRISVLAFCGVKPALLAFCGESGWNEASRVKMLELAKKNSPALSTLMDWLCAEDRADVSVWKSFIKGVVHNTTVPGGVVKRAWLMGPALANIVERKGKTDGRDLANMNRNFPVLAKLLEICPVLPEAVWPLLTEIAHKCSVIDLLPPQESAVPSRTESLDEELALHNCMWYPNLGAVRRYRGHYQKATASEKTKEPIASKTKEPADPTGCNKGAPKHVWLLPGLMLFFCIHGICLGWHVMEDPESPRSVFDVLFLLLDKAPLVVIYDNACSLMDYCLNREAAYFQHTRFLIDRLHVHNHVGCSSGYSIQAYAQYATINSQAAEQSNSKIQRIFKQASFMLPRNFAGYLRSYMTKFNAEKVRKMKQHQHYGAREVLLHQLRIEWKQDLQKKI
jgi:hypothetical protein